VDSLLVSAQTCVNFDDSLTPYFQYKRGLRQGNSLSPFLFDLITDALCQILKRGRDAGFIQGLGLELNNGHKIINFYYADDIIFLFTSRLSVYRDCYLGFICF
jgi:Reverse transcriptase (RNA-dependent DNA polymerase)